MKSIEEIYDQKAAQHRDVYGVYRITERQMFALIRLAAKRAAAIALQHGYEAGRMATIMKPGDAYSKAKRDTKLSLNLILRSKSLRRK